MAVRFYRRSDSQACTSPTRRATSVRCHRCAALRERTGNVTAAFPPTLITVGNADPLRPHSELLADKLATLGTETQTLFYPVGHQPPLGHEYQFDLDTDAGQLFLDHLLTFLRQRLTAPPQS